MKITDANGTVHLYSPRHVVRMRMHPDQWGKLEITTTSGTDVVQLETVEVDEETGAKKGLRPPTDEERAVRDVMKTLHRWLGWDTGTAQKEEER